MLHAEIEHTQIEDGHQERETDTFSEFHEFLLFIFIFTGGVFSAFISKKTCLLC